VSEEEAEKKMSVLGLSHFMIQTRDIKASLHFYSRVMELPVVRMMGTEEDPTFLFFPNLEIMPRKDPGAALDPEKASLHHVAFHVDDIEEMVNKMRKGGAEFLTPINVNKDGSRWAMSRDPNGNRIEVTTAPHF
jgi:lactoylglutathione lyase